MSRQLARRSSRNLLLTALIASVLIATVPPAGAWQVQRGAEDLRLRSPAPAVDLARVQVGAGERVVHAVPLGDGQWSLRSAPLTGGAPITIGGPLASPACWTLSPDGTRVVYLDLDLDLFVAPIDGSGDPVRLGDRLATGSPRDFVLAPDGSSVVYRAGLDERLGLYSVAMDGSAAPVELVSPASAEAVSPSYQVTPDGRSVVFGSHLGQGALARLSRVPVGGGATVALCSAPDGIEGFRITPGITTNFNPGALRVLYRSPEAGSGVLGLYSVPLDGREGPVRLDAALAAGTDTVEYEISFDGTRVVTLTDEGTNGRGQLFSAPADASAPPVRLCDALGREGNVSRFQLDPCGQVVLFVADQGQDEHFALWVAPIDGSSPAVEISPPLPGDGRVGWFAFTPDGRSAVVQVQRGLGSELWWVATTANPSRIRLGVPQDAHAFALGADGRRILYQDGSGGLQSLVLADRSRPITLAAATIDAYLLSPDGGHALFAATAQGDERGVPLFSVPVDGSAQPVRLGTGPDPAPGAEPPRTRDAEPWRSSGNEGAERADALADAGPMRSPVPNPRGGSRIAATTDVGLRAFSFGTTGTSTPTGEKPECKLWWNDGIWWGSLYNDAAQEHHIYGLDRPNQRWLDTGTVLDERNSSKADVLWDNAGKKLYVASHVFTTNASSTTAGNFGRLFRYSYDAAQKSYRLDAGFPVDITTGTAEALTIAKDTRGRLWATWTQSSRVMVNHSTTGDAQWSTPVILPASSSAVALTSDDISAIVAFGTSVGVMWSNQVTFKTYFAVHRDGDDPAQWQPEEVVIPDAHCSGTCSDDLFSLKGHSSGGVLVALKTSLTEPDQALNLVAQRGPNGGWTTTVFGRVRDHHTRPILLVDEQNSRVYVFATSPEDSGAIYYKSAPLSNLQFAVGLGTPFIQSSTDLSINNATSTKQNLNGVTDLLVMASDQDTRFYLYNGLDLAGSSGSPPAITSFSPTSGPAGTVVVITGARFGGTTSVRFNGTTAAFIVDSSSQIRAQVPTGATTGRIRVTTPDGSATSGSDFVVPTASGPAITSFTPTSGRVGTPVTITGRNFGGTTSVRFNGTTAVFTVDSSAQIRAAVPSGATSGRISVTTPNGNATSSGDFTVTRPPAITSFSPTSGPVGTVVTIRGSDFGGTTGVRFNGTPAPFTVDSSTQVRAQVPSGATSGRISVTTPNGNATSSGDFTITGGSPAITSFSPTSGPAGTTVTIRGSNFGGTTSVRFNGSAAGFQVDSSTQIRATVPSSATSGRISVTTANGSATSGADFRVTHPPIVQSFTPGFGIVATPVVITGRFFSGASSVSFGGRLQPVFTVLSDGTILAVVPLGACSGKIRVTTPEGSGESSASFTVVGGC